MRKKTYYLISILLISSCLQRKMLDNRGYFINESKEYFNLNFESSKDKTDYPLQWIIRNKGIEIILDSVEKISEKRSLKMESINTTDKNGFGVITSKFPVNIVKNKNLEFKGKIKTDLLIDGNVSLWLRVHKNDGTFSQDTIPQLAFKRDMNKWKKVSLNLYIDANAVDIYFGAYMRGFGKVWFDDFEIYLNGKKYLDVEPPKPAKEDIAWLKSYIHPLKSVNPKFKNNLDLEYLKQLVGDAKVVALGETTHGTSEIFKMKHRIIKYLTQNMNFDVFSIEANMPESYKINDYTIEGKGSPTELIQNMNYWTWQTEEFLGMVEWMKEQNKTDKKIQFTGFDMQFFHESIIELNDAFNDNPELLDTIAELVRLLDTIKEKREINNWVTKDYNEQKVKMIITKVKLAIKSKLFAKNKKNRLLRNTRLIEQFLSDTSYFTRDKYMAENLLWIKKQNLDSKIIVWAHNEHIKKTEYGMGKYLFDSLTNDYLSIGFTFHSGRYTAVGEYGLDCYSAQNSYLGTYEYIFNLIDEPIFVLDLRAIKNKKSKFSKSFLNSKEFRKVGAAKEINEFQKTNLAEDFDIIVFINETHCSTLID